MSGNVHRQKTRKMSGLKEMVRDVTRTKVIGDMRTQNVRVKGEMRMVLKMGAKGVGRVLVQLRVSVIKGHHRMQVGNGLKMNEVMRCDQKKKAGMVVMKRKGRVQGSKMKCLSLKRKKKIK